jgi:hypothetical protein
MTLTGSARTLAVFASAVVLAICVVGCTSPGSGGGQTTGARPSSSEQNVKVPADARRVDATTGVPKPFRTLRDGTVYVRDRNTGRVIYHGPVRAYDNVVIDPKGDAVTVNDQQVVKDPKLQPGHTYELFFVQH